MSSRATIAIITPGLRAANNGNFHTAARWARFLRPRFRVTTASAWSPTTPPPQCMIALHAKRSAASVAAFAETCPDRPRIVVLTGTDLYRDLPDDVDARRSLELATHLVVLQEAALDALEPRHRTKGRVIYQSARTLAPVREHARRTFDIVLVGHLRPEKDPQTPMRALLRLPAASRIRLVHVGEALDDACARAAREMDARTWPTLRRYVWLGARGHAETRRRIRDAQALVISSRMEGGANVIVEAVTAGIPVIASRIPGNVGMLAADYAGYFPTGDDAALARLFEAISLDASFLARLREQCAARAPLFEPAREATEVNRLVDEMLDRRRQDRQRIG